ncbi:MAG: glycosyltransferase [Clostridia bacterium]|nr:glycosyltransferase [Clostridia bacterium]MBQ9977733.1 glycosyltransferase [Clostridia bacterium]
MKTISVVVPVYNVENYLERCILSIINQTYQNLEIILVDDGSTDNSGAICDKLALKDPRIKVIHKENGGLSDARNAGIKEASGKYIGFVDSDDHIAPLMYEKLLSTLEENGADISICNYVYVHETTNEEDEEMSSLSPIKNELLTKREAFEKINAYSNGYSFYVTAWNKLYKKELFSDLSFAKGKLHEDEFIVHRLFEKCEKIAVCDDVLYFYIIRKGSIMNSKVSEKSLDAIDAIMDRYYFYLEKNEKSLAKKQLKAAFWASVNILQRLDESINKRKVNDALKPVKKALLKHGDYRFLYLLFKQI